MNDFGLFGPTNQITLAGTPEFFPPSIATSPYHGHDVPYTPLCDYESLYLVLCHMASTRYSTTIQAPHIRDLVWTSPESASVFSSTSPVNNENVLQSAAPWLAKLRHAVFVDKNVAVAEQLCREITAKDVGETFWDDFNSIIKPTLDSAYSRKRLRVTCLLTQLSAL